LFTGQGREWKTRQLIYIPGVGKKKAQSRNKYQARKKTPGRDYKSGRAGGKPKKISIIEYRALETITGETEAGTSNGSTSRKSSKKKKERGCFAPGKAKRKKVCGARTHTTPTENQRFGAQTTRGLGKTPSWFKVEGKVCRPHALRDQQKESLGWKGGLVVT